MRRSMRSALASFCGFLALGGCGGSGERGADGAQGAPGDSLIRPGEVRLANIEQLTFGGENAEAYWSWGGDALVMQATKRDGECDQIYRIDLARRTETLVSVEGGRTTCAYFLPGDEWILYSSTHLASPDCPPPPDRSQGYVWPIYAAYEIFKRPVAGGELVRLTDNPGYDAEATVGPDGTIVFTSLRDGDLDIYTMDSDGGNLRRLTDRLGYDGGAFFSPDGSRICYRAHHPTAEEEKAEYVALLERGLVRPSRMEIWVMDADGSNKRQLTDNGAANFAPFFHPSGEKVLFSSNLADPGGRNFDIFMIDLQGENLERITYEETFDGFPMFSPDGRRLVFCSNRNNER